MILGTADLTYDEVVSPVRMTSGAAALLILEAAYDLSVGRQDALRGIARAATHATPHGPVAVGCLDTHGQPQSVHFERADASCAARLLECHQLLPFAIRALTLSLTPRARRCHGNVCKRLSDPVRAVARDTFPRCVLANTGSGQGLHIVFGNPEMAEWPSARMHDFHAIAVHLAVAWRIGTSWIARPPAPRRATRSGKPC